MIHRRGGDRAAAGHRARAGLQPVVAGFLDGAHRADRHADVRADDGRRRRGGQERADASAPTCVNARKNLEINDVNIRYFRQPVAARRHRARSTTTPRRSAACRSCARAIRRPACRPAPIIGADERELLQHARHGVRRRLPGLEPAARHRLSDRQVVAGSAARAGAAAADAGRAPAVEPRAGR